MKGFKVLSIIKGDKFYSSCCPERGSLEYIKGVWIYPLKDCGPLSVFGENGLEFAKPYIKKHMVRYAVIFECEYKPSTEVKMWVPAINHEISGRELKGFDFPLRHAPMGTTLAEKVCITQIFENGKIWY